MAFIPRSARAILQSLVARIRARSQLTDITEGSGVMAVAAGFSEEINGVELRMARIRDSFSFDNVVGTDLDERVAELPGMVPRLPAVAATGEVMSLTRESAVGVQVMPEGAMFGRTDNSQILYRTVAPVTFPDGALVVLAARVICLTTGVSGNAPSGAINRIISAPSWVRGAVSLAPVSNGLPQETDDQLRYRAKLYLSSLCRGIPQAIEYAGLSFQASDRSRFKFVRLFEDTARPGYSELMVDDGTGLQNISRVGRAVSGTVPEDGNMPVLWHEMPATAPIQSIRVVRDGDDVIIPAQVGGVYRFVSIPERGLIHILNPAIFEPNDVWFVEGYNVYTGAVAELQVTIEGSNSSALTPGFRSAGTRVRVTPPLSQTASLDFHVVPVDGVGLEALEEVVLDDVIQFVATLGPGEPLLIAKLTTWIMRNQSVRNVHIYVGGSEPPRRAFDVYPSTARHVLRTSRANLRVIPSPEL